MATNSKSNFGKALALFKLYPALTVALFHALYCPNRSEKRAQQILNKMRKKGLLVSLPLVGNKHRYSLTQKGGNLVGVKKVKSLGAKAVIRSIALAAFVAENGITLKTKEDVKKYGAFLFDDEKWPDAVPSATCYTTPAGESFAIHTVLVDYGKHPRRIQKSIERIFNTLDGYAVARDLVAARLYKVEILVGHEGKAATLHRMKLPHRNLTIHVIQELGGLIGG